MTVTAENEADAITEYLKSFGENPAVKRKTKTTVDIGRDRIAHAEKVEVE